MALEIFPFYYDLKLELSDALFGSILVLILTRARVCFFSFKKSEVRKSIFCVSMCDVLFLAGVKFDAQIPAEDPYSEKA